MFLLIISKSFIHFGYKVYLLVPDVLVYNTLTVIATVCLLYFSHGPAFNTYWFQQTQKSTVEVQIIDRFSIECGPSPSDLRHTFFLYRVPPCQKSLICSKPHTSGQTQASSWHHYHQPSSQEKGWFQGSFTQPPTPRNRLVIGRTRRNRQAIPPKS